MMAYWASLKDVSLKLFYGLPGELKKYILEGSTMAYQVSLKDVFSKSPNRL